VEAAGPTDLRVTWRGKRAAERVELAGWVATGGDILAALSDPAVFAKASVGDYGSSVKWDDGEGDLAIDAIHLKKLWMSKSRSGRASCWNGNPGFIFRMRRPLP